MLNLIERYISDTRAGYSHIGNQPSDPTYAEVRDQVISFLTDRNAARDHRLLMRSLVAVLSQKAKISLVDDLLTEARDNQGDIDKRLLIDVAMEIIYPPTVLHGVKTEVKTEKEKGNYPYISFRHREFAKVMMDWSEEVSGPIDFFDVGCGLGDKLVLAHWFVDNISSITGVELNNHVYNLGTFFIGNLYNTRTWTSIEDAGRVRFGLTPLTMIEDDAFNIDYRPYNLIYMFQPIADPKKLNKLYRHIIKTMPVGGVMIEVLPGNYGETYDTIQELLRRKDLSVLDKDYYLVVKKIA